MAMNKIENIGLREHILVLKFFMTFETTHFMQFGNFLFMAFVGCILSTHELFTQ